MKSTFPSRRGANSGAMQSRGQSPFAALQLVQAGMITVWVERLHPREFLGTKVSRAMERLILQCPEQYLWSYNRYKVPSGVPAPMGEARS